jgi:hypothetical protein
VRDSLFASPSIDCGSDPNAVSKTIRTRVCHRRWIGEHQIEPDVFDQEKEKE